MPILQSYSDARGSITLYDMPLSKPAERYVIQHDYPQHTGKAPHLAQSKHYYADLHVAHKMADDKIRKALNTLYMETSIQLPTSLPVDG